MGVRADVIAEEDGLPGSTVPPSTIGKEEEQDGAPGTTVPRSVKPPSAPASGLACRGLMCFARRWPLWLFLIALVGVGALVKHFGWSLIKSVLTWFTQAGVGGSALFVALCGLWLVCLLPKTPLCVTAGYVYGWAGILVLTAGLPLGAMLSFAIVTSVRHCLGVAHLQERLLTKYPELQLMHSMMSTQPWRALVLSRLLYVPTPMKNYGLALLDAPLVPFVFAAIFSTLLFGVPLVYVGITLGDISAYLDGDVSTSDSGPIVKLLPPIAGVVLSIVVVSAFVRKLRTHLLKECPAMGASGVCEGKSATKAQCKTSNL